jgi:hypothetical protein
LVDKERVWINPEGWTIILKYGFTLVRFFAIIGPRGQERHVSYEFGRKGGSTVGETHEPNDSEAFVLFSSGCAKQSILGCHTSLLRS